MAGFNKGTKGSVGHAMSTDMSKKNLYSKPTSPDIASKGAAGPIPLPGTHEISIKPMENGMTVTHIPKATGKDSEFGGGDHAKTTNHVFTDAASAHAHLGKLMGCPGCAGQ